jgi:hypothetical protein
MQSVTIVSPKVSRAIGTSLTQVGGYSPASSAIVSGLSVANTSAGAVNVTITVFDGTNDTNLVFATPCAVGDSILLGADWFKFNLVAGWSIRVKSSVAASVDAAMFVSEFT